MIPLQTAAGHPVTHILFSPDGATVAVAQPHYGVTLLERTTGRALGVCSLPRRAALTGLAFCGDGRFLAAASAKGVEVFDAITGAPAGTSFHRPHKHLRLSERGEQLVGASAGQVRNVWAPDTGFISWATLASRPAVEWACAQALSSGGRYAILEVCAEREARGRYELFDVEHERVVGRVSFGTGRGIGPAKFCPLGRRFALNDGRALEVYDLGGLEEEEHQYADTPLVQRANGTNSNTAMAVAPMPRAVLEPMFTLYPDKPGAEFWYPPFALAADGRGLLVKRPRNHIQLWDAPTGTLVNEWSWQFEWVSCVAVSNDGLTAVAGGRFGRVLLWDLD